MKTKDENDGVDNINHLRSERNGTPRQLSHVEHNHHSIASGIDNIVRSLGLTSLFQKLKMCGVYYK